MGFIISQELSMLIIRSNLTHVCNCWVCSNSSKILIQLFSKPHLQPFGKYNKLCRHTQFHLTCLSGIPDMSFPVFPSLDDIYCIMSEKIAFSTSNLAISFCVLFLTIY